MSSGVNDGLIAKLGAGRPLRILSVLLGLSTLLAVAGFVYVTVLDDRDKSYLSLVGDQKVLSQEIAKYALASAAGNEESFEYLREYRDRFEANLVRLEKGDEQEALPALAGPILDDLKRVRENWNALRANADEILLARDPILQVRQLVRDITGVMPSLQTSSDQVVQLLVNQEERADQVFFATRQLMLVQRIENNINKVLAGGEDAAEAADAFGRDAALFGRILEGMLRGDDEMGVLSIDAAGAQEKLQEVAILFSSVSDQAGRIIEFAPDVLPAQFAANDVVSISDAVSLSSDTLLKSLETGNARAGLLGLPVGPWFVTVFGGLTLSLLVLVGLGLLAAANRRESESKGQNDRNQQAILTLLDEMGDLADGDLTVKATVSEDITGAIADSINYAIEALRSLVTTINTTSAQVSSSAQGTRATAMHLAEASEHQADQIHNATVAINAIAKSADEIYKVSRESSEVAEKSVDIASKGTSTVRRTIDGMDNIREQIQETSKRIKRLGESSQEIGDIVELIEDIADQTNILALNAAMQAAMAGESGRGFAVVADEVQRLAERSGNATKQIEALVKTIQTDTHEAVISMEQSTAGVVSGAKLAEDAGEALQEIESVSTYIARLIQGISTSAERQAAEAGTASDTMNVIQEITTQTTDGTNQTAESIGNLAELAEDLQKSVAGFRLPSHS